MTHSTRPMFKAGDLVAGKYRVEGIIGSGGMGVVLSARHEQLNTDVAIKLLRPAALENEQVVGRFMREARAAVSLRSEHVARVLDVGTTDAGAPYIVMERLQGCDLGAVCSADTRPAIGECVDYVMQACEAIAEAHSAGIIHRDLKPKNLFLTHRVDGRPLVKVLDFGISKIDPIMSPEEQQLTRTTEIIGSPSYMSPEQLRSSRNVDARSDIWSLGVILYELLCGRVPFAAETVTELVVVVVTERHPPVWSIRPDVPEALDAVVSRCLEKNPAARYQSVVELAQALEPFLSVLELTATERIRAVAARPSSGSVSGSIRSGDTGRKSGAPSTPSTSSKGATAVLSVPVPAAASSGRMNGGPGNTSVAWGETQSAPPPGQKPGSGSIPIPVGSMGVPSRRSTPALAVGIGALIGTLMLGAVAVFFFSTQRSTHPPPQPSAVAAKDDVPLPPGRKDLPPSTAPLPEPSTPPAVPSTLPEDRKPGPIPLPKPVAKPSHGPAPAQKPVDELDGIGRR